MHIKDLYETFEDLTEALDKYFHRKIVEARIRVNIEQTKNDLLQETAFRVLMKLNNDHYLDYSQEALIWFIAPDVWKRFILGFNRRMDLLKTMAGIYFSQETGNDSFSPMEVKELLASMRDRVGERAWNMIMLHTGGYTYKEIGNIHNLSEKAVKQAVWRWINDLRSGYEDDNRVK